MPTYLLSEEVLNNSPTVQANVPHKIEMKLQSIAKRGGWTSGRQVKYYDFRAYVNKWGTRKEKDMFNSFAEYSSRAGSNAIRYSDFYYDTEDFTRALVGFPHLWHLKNKKVKIDLIKTKPSFFVEERDELE